MPYAVNSEFARVYGDMGTGVWIAPTGTTLPTDLTTDPAGFDPVGWLHDDGIGFKIEKDVKDFNALQGGSLVRRKVGKVTETFTFTALEESALVLGLVHAGNAPTINGGVATLDIGTSQNRTVTRALVIDTVDGDVQKRFTISAADITYEGEIAIAKNDDLVAYEFSATVIAGAAAMMITNSPGIVGSAPVAP